MYPLCKERVTTFNLQMRAQIRPGGFHVIRVTAGDAAFSSKALRLPLGAASP